MPENEKDECPCKGVVEIYGKLDKTIALLKSNTDAEIKSILTGMGHLKEDHADMQLQTRECLEDMKKGADMMALGRQELALQNLRLKEGDVTMADMKQAITDMPLAVTVLFETHLKTVHDAADKKIASIQKKVKKILVGCVVFLIFFATTEHGKDMLRWMFKFFPA